MGIGKVVLICAASLFTDPGPALANFGITGNSLRGMCSPTASAELANGCSGYEYGVVDALELFNGTPSDNGGLATKFCIPTGVDIHQLQDVIAKALQEHPETREQSASLLILQALYQYFPCK